MGWSKLETPWSSLLLDRPLLQPVPPFTFVTPAQAWDYGAFSAALPRPGADTVLRVRARSIDGSIGLVLMKPNGSALLSAEGQLTPAAGVVDTYFRLHQSYGDAALLLRAYDESNGEGSGELLDVSIGTVADVASGAVLLGPAEAHESVVLPPRHASNVAHGGEPLWPVSLGNTCEAKVQIARVLQFRRWPETSQAAFRLKMLPPKRSEGVFGWDLFDWQGAPFNAVLTYLREDFRGVFDREDLEATPTGVMHRRLACEHFHDFEHLKKSADPVFTEAMVDEGYPQARARFERLAEAFRSRLASPGPYLYIHVCEDIPTELRVRQLIAELSSRSPLHRFHLLFVGFEDEDSDLSALADQVSKAYRPRPQSGAADWEGDYDAWDRALAPFHLLLPSEQPPRPKPPSGVRRRGLISRLFDNERNARDRHA